MRHYSVRTMCSRKITLTLNAKKSNRTKQYTEVLPSVMFRKKPVSSYRPDPETAAAYAPGAPASQPARKNPGLRFPRIL